MKLRIDRILSIATLIASLAAIVLVLKKPQPVATPQQPAAIAANAQSFQNKIEQLGQPKQEGQQAAEVRLNSDEINAALAEANAPAPMPTASPTTSAASAQSPTTSAGNPADPNSFGGVTIGGMPDIKDYQVRFEGDVVHGQFLTEVAGKDVWITVSGHLNSQDGYATFDPTEFKVGDMNVPVSLVNPALQKRLAEQRDRMKLPDSISGIGVENGQLVVKQK